SGIPKTDPFSYSMPSYPFVDHEWLSNIIIYLIYSKIGWLALAVLYSIIPLWALLIQVLRLPSRNRTLLLILSAVSISVFVGIRTQMVSILFFSIVTAFFTDNKFYQKYKYFLPFLFLIWANLHGSFAIGIAVFGLYLLVKFFKDRKIVLSDLTLLTVSAF